MSSKLFKANAHLRDPVARDRAIRKSVASSSAIEGIRAPFTKSGTAQGKSGPKARKGKG